VAKRKKNKVDTTPKVKESCGYRISDVVYSKIVTGEIRTGEIVKFHPGNEGGPAFTFLDMVDSKYLVAMIDWIIDKPTAAQKKKALKNR